MHQGDEGLAKVDGVDGDGDNLTKGYRHDENDEREDA